jgi:hypothetical protein
MEKEREIKAVHDQKDKGSQLSYASPASATHNIKLEKRTRKKNLDVSARVFPLSLFSFSTRSSTPSLQPLSRKLSCNPLIRGNRSARTARLQSIGVCLLGSTVHQRFDPSGAHCTTLLRIGRVSVAIRRFVRSYIRIPQLDRDQLYRVRQVLDRQVFLCV